MPPDKKLQLFLLPFAGGSAAAFLRLTENLSPAVEAVTVEYAGRGTRAREPLAEDFSALLEDATNYIRRRRRAELPYALFGYSMGSLLAWELAAQERIGGKLEWLFLAAEVSPVEQTLSLRQSEAPTDEWIFSQVERFGGLDERIMSNPRFAKIYMRPMLSDFRRFCEYRFHDPGHRLKTDATIFYCDRDTPRQHVEKWRELIDGTVDLHEFGDNHFFINRFYREMAEIMNARLAERLEL